MGTPIITWDIAEPLKRAQGETKRANQALRDYAALGVGRSIDKLHARYIANESQIEPPTKSRHTLAGWSIRYDWQRRVAEYDRQEEEAFEQQRREWRRQLIEQDWEHGQRLRELSEKILAAAPSFIRRREKIEKLPDGGERRIITVALDANALARVEKLASDLQRLAAGEPTANVKITDWRGEIADMLRRGEISVDDLRGELDEREIDEITTLAGVVLYDDDSATTS